DCCACTGVTKLISATATADAIGVFLSFMSLPLIGFALKNYDAKILRIAAKIASLLFCDYQCHYTTSWPKDATNRYRRLVPCCNFATARGGCLRARQTGRRQLNSAWPMG